MTESVKRTKETIPRIITNFYTHLQGDTLAMVELKTYLDTEKRQSIQEVIRVHYHDKTQVAPLVLLKTYRKGEELEFCLEHFPLDFTSFIDCSPDLSNTIHLSSNFEELGDVCNSKLLLNKRYVHNKSGNYYQVVTTVKDINEQEFVIYTCMDKNKFTDNHYIFAREIESFLGQDEHGKERFTKE